MSSDATTIPIRHSPEDSRRGSLGRVFTRLRADTRAERLIGAVSLVSIVAVSLLLVVITADRPSGLAPTTHTGFFPNWMAGPLGGLWPGLTSNGTTLRWLFTIALLVMYLAYVLVLSSAPSLSARWVIGAILAVHVVYLRGAADGAHRRLQLHQLRAHGDRAPPEPVYDDADQRAPRRPGVRAEQLAPAPQPVRADVHAHHVRCRAARRGRLVLGAQGAVHARRASRSSSWSGSARCGSGATRCAPSRS